MEDTAAGLRRAPVRTDPFRCLRVRHYLSTCANCSEACPRQAIALGPGPNVDAARCNGCGVCAAVCPTEALALRGLAIEDVVAAAKEGEVAFCCPHAAGGRGTQVPCLGFLDEGALLALAAQGREVALESGPCAACPDSAGLASAQRAAALANAILTHFGAPGRIVFTQTRPFAAAASLSRRHLFGFLRHKARERLEPDPDAPVSPVAKGSAIRGALHPARRAMLLAAVGRLQEGSRQKQSEAATASRSEPRQGRGEEFRSSNAEILHPATGGVQNDKTGTATANASFTAQAETRLPFYSVTIAEACDNCGMCLTFCPTAALRLERAAGTATYQFAGDFCLGCGLCVDVCPKGAVEMQRLNEVPKMGVASVLLARAWRRCAGCGTEFLAAEDARFCRACLKKQSLGDAIRHTLFGV